MWELLVPALGKLLDKVLPDTEAANQAKAELLKLQLSGELQQVMGQLEINKMEAASTNWWVAGWRPAIGWICGAALAYAALFEPVGRFMAKVWFGYTGDFPIIDTNLTMQILLGMLGLGAMRTTEKLKDVEGRR